MKRIAFMCKDIDHQSWVFSPNSIQDHQVLETNVFFESDALKGILVTYEARIRGSRKSQLELYAQPVSHFVVHRRPGPTDRLISLQVRRPRDLEIMPEAFESNYSFFS